MRLKTSIKMNLNDWQPIGCFLLYICSEDNPSGFDEGLLVQIEVSTHSVAVVRRVYLNFKNPRCVA